MKCLKTLPCLLECSAFYQNMENLLLNFYLFIYLFIYLLFWAKLYSPWNSPGQNIGVGSPSLLHGIFPT